MRYEKNSNALMASNKAKPRKDPPNKKRGSWLLLLLFIPLIAGIIFGIMPRPKQKPAGPVFQKQGELQFHGRQSREVLTGIDIELARDEMSRARGLMWRRSLGENEGMLFIMEAQEVQSFWMLNTYIPLDILFVDEQKQIVTIRSNTAPQSLQPVTSDKPALYVVEVNAGFCKKHGIETGDYIDFRILDQ